MCAKPASKSCACHVGRCDSAAAQASFSEGDAMASVAVSSVSAQRASRGQASPCSSVSNDRRARAYSRPFLLADAGRGFAADIVSIQETLESAPTAGDGPFTPCRRESYCERSPNLALIWQSVQPDRTSRVLLLRRTTPAAPFRRPRSVRALPSVGTGELPR